MNAFSLIPFYTSALVWKGSKHDPSDRIHLYCFEDLMHFNGVSCPKLKERSIKKPQSFMRKKENINLK